MTDSDPPELPPPPDEGASPDEAAGPDEAQPEEVARPDEAAHRGEAGQPEEAHPQSRRRATLAGVGAAILAVAAMAVAPALGGRFGPALVTVPLIVLAAVAYNRRGTGFGAGVAIGCGVLLLVGGGTCIAILMSFQ